MENENRRLPEDKFIVYIYFQTLKIGKLRYAVKFC